MSGTFEKLFNDPSKRVATVANVGALPNATTVPIGSERVTANDGTLYISDGTTWNSAGGGGGSVASVNGQSGVVVVQVGDGSIPSTGTSLLTYSNASNELDNMAGHNVAADSPSGALTLNRNLTVQPDNLGGKTFDNYYLAFTPLQNSPNESWNGENYYYDLDPGASGFAFGTSGEALCHMPVTFNAQGTGNLGGISFLKPNFSIGNGTDPITWRGFSYAYGFGSINANVTLNGPIQGYGFQFSMNALASVGSGSYVNAFYDNANVSCPWSASWTSYQASPNIAEITNNNNYTGMNVSPNIALFSGNASLTGIAISPTVSGMGYGSSFNGISINPQTSTVNSFQGIFVSVDNVTTFAGAQATLTEQDLTFTRNAPGEDANSITLEYVGGGTAGSEVVSNIGLAFTVQIQNGVSTATQIKAALDASNPWGSNITTTISGVGSDPQNVFGPSNFSGGLWAGAKKAAYFDGDVDITGSLTFGGALSIGALQSFGPYTVASGAGVASVSTLITSPTVAANATITGTDLLGVNTAMLMNIGANASVTSSFLGYAGLGLPAVLSMATGSTIDRVSGAVFAVSLDVSATGGTADTLSLCRSLALPNGVTTVNRLYGYEFDLPFGDPATTSWGLYIKPAVNNWLSGRLRIGGTAITDDTASYELHVTGDTYLDGNFGAFGTLPVSQQPSSGAVTAGGTYTATEQAMLQEAYNALRAYGLLS